MSFYMGVCRESVRTYLNSLYDVVGASTMQEAAIMILASERLLHEIYDDEY